MCELVLFMQIVIHLLSSGKYLFLQFISKDTCRLVLFVTDRILFASIVERFT